MFFVIGLNIFVATLVGWAFSVSQNSHTVKSEFPKISDVLTPSKLGFTDPTLESTYNIHPAVATDHWMSWSLLDRKSGVVIGSDNSSKPSYMMSTIKPWIAADYLNSHPSPSDSVLAQLSTMIVDSNDQVAYQYFGGQASLDRMAKTCGLTDVVERSWSWSLTEVSARDAVRLGECIYGGKATTAAWTAWIVDKMRHVQGLGDFGPRELFIERTQVATKNGWYDWEGKWYINCLSITDGWVISTIQQWPYTGGPLSVGIAQADPVCDSVAIQVLKLSIE
ncbi:MAG TPA: hypothetical protein VIY48_16590 [Candidatus Paceibacterota bacterium]